MNTMTKNYLTVCVVSMCALVTQALLPSKSVALTFNLPEESFNVSYVFGPNGVTTNNRYIGDVRVTVAGGGLAAGSQYSDAFWLYESDGNIVPAREFGLVINRYSSPPLQPRNPTGYYQFTYSLPPVIINPGSSPNSPLTFGVGDTFVSDNSGGYSVKVQAITPTQRFSNEQKAAFKQSAEKDKFNAALLAVLGSAGCIALGVPIPNLGIACEISVAGYAAFYNLRAQYKERLALDPIDPNFTTVVQPTSVTIPDSFWAKETFFPTEVATAFNKSLQDIANELSIFDALIVSLDRLDGAEAAGDLASRDKQIVAATSYASELGMLQIASANSFSDLLSKIKAADQLTDPFLTSNDLLVTQTDLLNNGLSKFQFDAIEAFIKLNQPKSDGTGIGSRLTTVQEEAEIFRTNLLLVNSLEFSTGSYTDKALSTIDGYIESGNELKKGILASSAQPVPTPALLPGLIGMGIAALRKRKQEQKETVEV
ncbi:PTPA-CTERM sorting domain-containing protein [Cyanobacteria bacterium FACHB-502]|nr:PTPA-CTERM sorting domain-containing protein [Cyanobacteria bacterium FACHB-502]